jgi:hypothetical protein
MKNIHILPTEKPTYLYEMEGKLHLSDKFEKGNDFWHNQNIYITSDKEIKEENLTKSIYVIDVQNGNIGKLTCKNRFFKGSCKLIGIEWSNKQDIWNYYHIKEIILTTDPSLIADGVQAIDDEFLEWFVKNQSCEEVEVKDLYSYTNENTEHIGYKIVIPKEEPKLDLEKEMFELEQQLDIPSNLRWHNSKPKQETLEEVASNLAIKSVKEYMRTFPSCDNTFDYRKGFEEGFIQGVKWEQEQNKNKYSEEEVYNIIEQSLNNYHLKTNKGYLKQWFEQFKKK